MPSDVDLAPEPRPSLAEARLSGYGSASVTPSPVSRMMQEFSRDYRAGIDINLGVGYVNEATIPRDAIAAAVAHIAADPVRLPHTFNYGEPRGSANLIAALRRFLIRHRIGGLDETVLQTREIIIGANGATSILDAFAHVLPRGVVVTTDPQYYIYCDILRRMGFAIHAVPEDEEGADVAAVEAVLMAHGDAVSFVYVVTVGNPSAAVLSNQRRRQLVQAVTRASRRLGRKIPLLLDQAYEWLVHDAASKLDSGALWDEAGVVYELGTLSKVLAPALRVGFLLGPPGPLLTALVQRTNDAGFSAPLLNQEAAAHLLDTFVDSHLERVRAGYRHKSTTLLAALRREWGPYLHACVGGRAGFYYYVTLNGIETVEGSPFHRYCSRTTGDAYIDSVPASGREPAARAPRLLYLPGEFCVAKTTDVTRRQLRLSFGFADERELEHGARILGEATRYAAAKGAAPPASARS